jgi:hypothetical protein
MIDPFVVFPFPVAEQCWNCAYGLMEAWRHCPNCGLWLKNQEPIRVVQNRHENYIVLIDSRQHTA